VGHYAKVLDGNVVNVLVAEAEFFDNFVDSSPGVWIQTSYNTRGGVYYTPNSNTPDPDQTKALRKNFAGVGYAYDFAKDAFIPPKPYASWTLDEASCTWVPPIPQPTGGTYVWDEATQAWFDPTTP
jgi:hypothetical protein